MIALGAAGLVRVRKEFVYGRFPWIEMVSLVDGPFGRYKGAFPSP